MTVQPLVRPQYQTLSEISTKIKSKLTLIQEVDTELNKLHSIVKELRKNNSLRTQAFKIIIRLQGLIENISDIKQKSNEALLDIQETELNQKIAELNIKISEDEDNILLKEELNTLLKDKELLYKGNSNEFKNILEIANSKIEVVTNVITSASILFKIVVFNTKNINIGQIIIFIKTV